MCLFTYINLILPQSMKVALIFIFFLSVSTLAKATTAQFDDLLGPDGQDLEPGYIGLIQHDVERRLDVWEDHTLPVPTHIHVLGQC